MTWYIFKKLSPRVTESQLAKAIKNHIKLKMYNKTFITQLGMCTVIITYKNNKKTCEFFVVPEISQVLLGMPDTAALNIINANIDSIEAEGTKKENCNTNISDTKKPNTKQETHWAKKSFRNTEEDLKNTNNVNGLDSNTNTNTLTHFFLSSPNIEMEIMKIANLTQKYAMCLIMFLMASGTLKAHFCYSSSLTVSPIKHHQDM